MKNDIPQQYKKVMTEDEVAAACDELWQLTKQYKMYQSKAKDISDLINKKEWEIGKELTEPWMRTSVTILTKIGRYSLECYKSTSSGTLRVRGIHLIEEEGNANKTR